MARRLLFLLVPLLLAGCAGKPTQYLTLSPQPSDQTYVAAGAPVSLAHVAIPPVLDRLYLTTMLSGNQLHVAEHTRWAAPLDGIMQSVLARDLATRLTGTRVLMPGDEPPHGGVRLVRVNVQGFIPDQTGRVTLDADWTVLSVKQKVIAQDRAHIVIQGGRTPAAEAQSMSMALGQLADQIAGRIE
jgi:uncharacterized lipoprotein YmbA